jgi:hypothetical protein
MGTPFLELMLACAARCPSIDVVDLSNGKVSVRSRSISRRSKFIFSMTWIHSLKTIIVDRHPSRGDDPVEGEDFFFDYSSRRSGITSTLELSKIYAAADSGTPMAVVSLSRE